MPTEPGDSGARVFDPVNSEASVPAPILFTKTPAPLTAPRTPGSRARHVQVVDGLRGIAILLVLLFHYWQLSFWVIPIPGLPERYNLEFLQYAGYLGVELFFFISAFCLFYPHAKTMFGQGSVPTLKHFFYRRAIKILPSYLLALLIFGVFSPVSTPQATNMVSQLISACTSLSCITCCPRHGPASTVCCGRWL